MRNSWLILTLVACARREENAEPPKSGNAVQLSRQQIEGQQMRVEVAQEQEVGTSLEAPGHVSFDDQRVSHIFLPVSGRIVKVYVAPGQQVKKGDPLAEVESPDAGSALSDLGKAQAAANAAEHEYRRQRELYEAHAGAQRDLEQSQSAAEQAKAELARARSRAGLFQATSPGRRANAATPGYGGGQGFTLRAPLDGEVISRSANPGMEVQGQYAGGASAELFTIGSLDPIWAYAEVYEVDLPRVKVGAPVTVKVVAYPDRSFSGHVEWISSSLDAASRTARIRCTLRNPNHELLPEMYSTVSIVTPARRTLAIPRSAIVHVGEERVVFVQTGSNENGLLKFERRRVVLEESDSDPVPVKSGLSPGEAVVVSGALLMSGML
jgi:membrane fusion protein, heavy metal efflux system